MHYIRIQQEYLDYLQKMEPRIPNQDYGEHKYKPFFILSSLNGEDVLYVTQLTSPKPRHENLKETLDFKKIYHPSTGKYLGATNLNYMFPVLPEYIEHLSYKDLKEILQSDKRVQHLAIQKKQLEKIYLEREFDKLYELKYHSPNSKIAQRCLDFKQLETYMLTYKLHEEFQQDIIVERSKDHSTFFVHTSQETYVYPQTILSDMFTFLSDLHDKLSQEMMITFTHHIGI